MLRHQSIRSLTSKHAEMTAHAAIRLWEQMATQIIAIVGEDGFDSLFARGVSLAQARFPWLSAGSASRPADHRFANLKACFEGTTPELAGEANRLLLIIFTDILASLIGEPLTERILNSAWGSDTQYKANKDSNP